ncbi:VOC family protein [Streptomyces sp. YKOK-I1]
MNLSELSYVVIGATDVEAWRSFGAEVLGAMPVDGPDGTLRLKLDERVARLHVLPDTTDRLIATGWGTFDERDYDEALKALRDAGIETADATAGELRIRQVERMVSFRDPAGNTHEISCGPAVDGRRFVSPVGVPAFVTGETGMGHVVLPTGDRYDATVAFFTDVIGLGRANARLFPRQGADPARVRFFHCNERQHSLALGEVRAPSGCIHIALEVGTIDEVGRALDRAAGRGVLARTLGRHINDGMLSCYLTTPGGFQIEYGYCDHPPTWPERSYFVDTVGSYWGHAWIGDANPVTS